ncbi:gluconokinase [uncultured Shewanella sp.]|uniref:gluconokinase n=1 Tax=uncultured Shewanella sp. TaxID=173975 RepID=UPI0026265CF0|nr:gluconokinase [uncultured Shewanella sp.]
MYENINGRCLIIMGVSCTGKSSIGRAIAQAVNAKFIDGDDLHPKDNIIKMASGQSLNDEDRQPWLENVRDAIGYLVDDEHSGVMVCSALKKQYRDVLREGNEKAVFLHLYGSFELVLERMKMREDHFMPIELLQSQFDTLVFPSRDEDDVYSIHIEGTFEQVLGKCLCVIRQL